MWRLILISLLALANISPSFFSLWGYDGEEIRRLTSNEVKTIDIYLSGGSKTTGSDGGMLCLQRKDEGVRIFGCADESGITPWQSPPEWEVREVIYSDLNRDGEEELSLLVWRPFQAWPVDKFLPSGGRIAAFHDNHNKSCHLILIGLAEGEIQELWAGSAMSDPIRELHAVDLDGDGMQELAALEYVYNGNPRSASITVWSWNGFGFSLQNRQEGSFSSLLVLPAGSVNVLLAHQDL